MPAHDRNSPDFKVNERAVEFQKARYEESLAAVQEEEPNLPIVEQRKLAAKKVRWNKQSFQRGNPNVKGDRFYLKALHALCVEEDVGEVCSDMTYEDWKERFKVNDKKLDNWSRIARQDLLWGVVQATNSQNKKLGELTIRQIDQTALGKAITTFEKREGLCESFERIEFSVEALTFLKTIRDRTSPTIPSMPGSISHLYANNKREATHCGLIDFESNQVLLKLTRGVNLNIDGKTLLNMKKKDIEEAVTDYMSSTFPKLSKKSREFKLQWGLRCITIKWCKHTLRWMISRFEKKACCLLGRIVDTTNLDTSILDTIETIQKIPTQSTTTSTARRRSSTRRKSATSLSSLELKAAFFPGPGKHEYVPRRLCIGMENKNYYGACTNEMPMSVITDLAVCLSIPMLLNTDAGVAIAAKMKGTKQEIEDATGICVDRKHILRRLKASFVPAKPKQLATHYLHLPKAPSSDTKELSNTDISLNDTLVHNETVRAKRRGEHITESGKLALASGEPAKKKARRTYVDSLSVSEEDSPSSQTLSTLDSDSLSGSEPAKKKALRTSVESSSPTQSNPVEDPSSERRRVFMHGGHNNGKTAKPWDKEAKRHRAATYHHGEPSSNPSDVDTSLSSNDDTMEDERSRAAKKSASSSLSTVSNNSSPSDVSDDSADSDQEQPPRVTRSGKQLGSRATKSTSIPKASKKKEKQSEKKLKWQVAEQTKSSTRKPDCNCSYCSSDRNKAEYTQSQHRNVQTMAAYHEVMQQIDDEINPSEIEKEHVYFTKEEYDSFKDEASFLRREASIFIEEMEARGTCDTDHLIGRLEEIFNSIYTTFPCSHTSNSCYSVIRWLAGDWCYGLSELKYTGGN